MHHVNVVLSILVPIFSLILLGYVAQKRAWISEGGAPSFNRYVYHFALPCLLFLGVVETPADDLFQAHFILANLGGVLLCFLIAILGSAVLFHTPARLLPLRGMVACYGATGYMGLPLLLTAFGPPILLAAAYGTLLQSIPIITIVIVLCEMHMVSHAGRGWFLLLNLAKAVLGNPLVIAVLLGILLSVQQMPLPPALLTTIRLLGNSASACALFALGGSVAPQVEGNAPSITRHELCFLLLLKLIVHPVLTWGLITSVLPLAPGLATTSVLLSGLPTGTVAAVLAEKYGSDTAGTSQVIVLSMLCSSLSLGYMLWLWL